MRTRTKALLVGLFVLTVIVAVGGAPFLSPIGSGSGWEIDQFLLRVDFNGEVYEQDTGDDTVSAPADDVTGGGGGGGGAYYVLSFLDAYNFIEDPDGEPRIEGTVIEGRASAFYIAQSGWRRVDQLGNVLTFSQDDPLQVSHVVGDKTVYEYYYEFEIRGGTESDIFPYYTIQLCECSSVEAVATVRVELQETIFGPVDGFFQDATVVAYDHIDLQLDSGLDFDIHPQVHPVAAGYILEIQDRQDTESAYTANINIPFRISAGTTKTGTALLSRNPYDVWLEYTVRFTILLEEPLDIGTQGQTGLTGGDAPTYNAPFDWRLVVIIIGVALFVALLFFIWVRFRRQG